MNQEPISDNAITTASQLQESMEGQKPRTARIPSEQKFLRGRLKRIALGLRLISGRQKNAESMSDLIAILPAVALQQYTGYHMGKISHLRDILTELDRIVKREDECTNELWASADKYKGKVANQIEVLKVLHDESMDPPSDAANRLFDPPSKATQVTTTSGLFG